MEPQEKLGKLKGFLYGTLLGNLVVFLIVLFFIYLLIGLVKETSEYASEEDYYAENFYEGCNVAGINLHGTIETYIPYYEEGDTGVDYDVVSSEDIVWYIDDANWSDDVRAIVIEVDSTGGSPVAGEEIANAVKNSEKPVVAFIRDIGASAAYWAVSSADRIYASRNSDVGSIGVSMSYLNEVELNKKEGFTFEQLSVGKYKDAGNVDKPLTAEERVLFLRDLNIIYENFIEDVAKNRGLSIEQVRSIADGSTVLGERAKELGLIDEIGSIGEVEAYLAEVLGEEPVICWQ